MDSISHHVPPSLREASLLEVGVGEEEEHWTVSLETWVLAPDHLACSPWPQPRLPRGDPADG